MFCLFLSGRFTQVFLYVSDAQYVHRKVLFHKFFLLSFIIVIYTLNIRMNSNDQTAKGADYEKTYAVLPEHC